jgi:hypothetical protein
MWKISRQPRLVVLPVIFSVCVCVCVSFTQTMVWFENISIKNNEVIYYVKSFSRVYLHCLLFTKSISLEPIFAKEFISFSRDFNVVFNNLEINFLSDFRVFAMSKLCCQITSFEHNVCYRNMYVCVCVCLFDRTQMCIVISVSSALRRKKSFSTRRILNLLSQLFLWKVSFSFVPFVCLNNQCQSNYLFCHSD